MKKLFLSMAILFAMGTVFTACGDDASGDTTEAEADGGEGEGESGDKSICECMKMRIANPDLKEPPKGSGCEWVMEISDEEGKKLMEQAMVDCPEVIDAIPK